MSCPEVNQRLTALLGPRAEADRARRGLAKAKVGGKTQHKSKLREVLGIAPSVILLPAVNYWVALGPYLYCCTKHGGARDVIIEIKFVG